MSEPTVHIEVTLSYNFAGSASETTVVDTEISLAEWNEMTDDQRAEVADQVFKVTHENAFSGGMGVVTEGAEDI